MTPPHLELNHWMERAAVANAHQHAARALAFLADALLAALTVAAPIVALRLTPRRMRLGFGPGCPTRRCEKASPSACQSKNSAQVVEKTVCVDIMRSSQQAAARAEAEKTSFFLDANAALTQKDE